MKQGGSDKKILWYSLAFMAFSTVWAFGNVINGFSEYGGLKAIISWVIILRFTLCHMHLWLVNWEVHSKMQVVV